MNGSQNNSRIFQDFFIELEKLWGNSSELVITTHLNADVDGIASVIGFKELLQKKYNQLHIQIIVPEISVLARNILRSVEMENNFETQWPPEIPILILMDTNDIAITNLPKKKETNEITIPIAKIIIIDHHLKKEKSTEPQGPSLISNEYPSNCEIVYSMYKTCGLLPDPKVLKLLAFGILTDTGNFRYANNGTFSIFQEILAQGVDYREIIAKLNFPIGKSERIARLKAASRIEKVHDFKEFLILFSHVSSYEASAAKALIDMGADLVFIVDLDKKEQFQITARASESIILKTKFHLGKFLSRIGLLYEGDGGGHDGAGGCYGKKMAENLMDNLTTTILKELQRYLKELEQVV